MRAGFGRKTDLPSGARNAHWVRSLEEQARAAEVDILFSPDDDFSADDDEPRDRWG